VWNTPPGALTVMPEFSHHELDFPFYWRRQPHLVNELGTTGPLVNESDTADLLPKPLFTALVYVTRPDFVSGVYRLVKTLGRSSHLHKVCTFGSVVFVAFYRCY